MKLLHRAGLALFLTSFSLFAACGDDGTPSDGGGGAGGGTGAQGGGTTSATSGEGGGSGGEGGGAGGEGGGAALGPTEVPSFFRMTASAQASENGTDVSCAIDFIFELGDATVETDEMIEYPGNHGGDASRSIFARNGDGFVFNASSAGEVVATLRFTGTELADLDLAIPLNETAENAFWQELALFSGTLAADGTGSGSWRCAPLEISQDGYVDETVYADGTWQIEPLR